MPRTCLGLRLSLGGRQRGAARGHRERLDVRLPLSRQLEELHAVPLGAVDIHWNDFKDMLRLKAKMQLHLGLPG